MKRVTDVIRAKTTFLVTSHVRLDGDAVGSELALFHLLRNMGKKVLVYNQDETPRNLRFLPGAETIVHKLDGISEYDVLFVLDCSEVERVGEAASLIRTAPCLVSIDHHISNKGDFSLSVIDPSASSVGELIFRLIDEMGADVTKEIAVNLYTAIVTDTGSFRYSNAGKNTFAIAGKLVEAGAKPHKIAEKVYESNPPEKMKLLAKVLETLECHWDGKISTLFVSQAMIREAGALPEYTENFVDFARAIEGVEVAAFFIEMDGGRYRVSLRSKGRISVEKVARTYGGGGHFNAAACIISGSLVDVRDRIVQSIMAG
ncbi:MAG: bifunctional oligoribonuclease/PAP phosphatase NrnA [Syntrophobacterales bacterium]|nr:bifunctional oligoribonuclease/PAP phosphatase NrnA [Syntrophobacterales bacterium]